MSGSGSSLVSTKVLGKRKHNESLVLHFSSASSYAPSESELEEPTASSVPAQLSSCPSPPRASDSKMLRFRCEYTGCNKSYKKRSRLEEHERSHTGERPFVCQTCEKSYLRETHLQAHARSHLPASDRPFACSDDSCEKRFWTKQHLHVHIEKVHNREKEKAFKCTALGCNEAFAKHHQLRTHYVGNHAPPGTKSYICDHPGCEKSFATNQKLKAHIKVHDKERYTCSHPDCLRLLLSRPSEEAMVSYDLNPHAPASSTAANSIQFFPNWTSLQAHMRTAHPPMCVHPDCINPTTGKSKTFTTRASLRTHMKIHELRDREAALALEADDEQEDGGDSDEENKYVDDRPIKKPRRGGELGRDFICAVGDCGKDFKSKQALDTHNVITHLGRRDFHCEFPGCGKTYGYKRLLVKHMAKHLRSHSPSSKVDGDDSGDSDDNKSRQRIGSVFNTANLTGETYASRPTSFVRCPYPDFHGLTLHLPEHYSSGMQDRNQEDCEYTFRRAYDLRRHLRAVHDLDLEKSVVDRWAARMRSSHP